MSIDTQTGKCQHCGLLTDSDEHECSAEPYSEPIDEHIGKIIGDRYELLSRIGEGGTSVVYKARTTDSGEQQIVAVKILKPHASTDKFKLAGFEREAKSIRRLSHANIIRLHHFEVPADGEPYLVMDYLEGKPLSDVFIEDGVFSLERCIKVFSQVCDGLSHAHRAGVVHTDVKPSNIIVCLVDGVETVKIVDFGIAKLLNGDNSSQSSAPSGEVLGSPLYMSPEQCAARTLDARSDIYSTACVIYESLTGDPPLVGKTPRDTMHMHVFDTPERISKLRPALAQSALLETVMIKALAKHPDQRYQSMRELRLDLELELELNGTELSEWPGKPLEKPAETRIETLVAAGIETPVAAGFAMPVAAGFEMPDAAGLEVPVAAGTEAPVAAGVETPVAAGVETPVAAGVETPVAAGVETPVAAGIETPVEKLDAEAAPVVPPSSAVPVDHYLGRIRQIRSAYNSLFQSRRR